MHDLPELESRICKCGCGKSFRVLPSSKLYFSSLRCGNSRLINANYLFGPACHHQDREQRRWVKQARLGISTPKVND